LRAAGQSREQDGVMSTIKVRLLNDTPLGYSIARYTSAQAIIAATRPYTSRMMEEPAAMRDSAAQFSSRVRR